MLRCLFQIFGVLKYVFELGRAFFRLALLLDTDFFVEVPESLLFLFNFPLFLIDQLLVFGGPQSFFLDQLVVNTCDMSHSLLDIVEVFPPVPDV